MGRPITISVQGSLKGGTKCATGPRAVNSAGHVLDLVIRIADTSGQDYDILAFLQHSCVRARHVGGFEGTLISNHNAE